MWALWQSIKDLPSLVMLTTPVVVGGMGIADAVMGNNAPYAMANGQHVAAAGSSAGVVAADDTTGFKAQNDDYELLFAEAAPNTGANAGAGTGAVAGDSSLQITSSKSKAPKKDDKSKTAPANPNDPNATASGNPAAPATAANTAGGTGKPTSGTANTGSGKISSSSSSSKSGSGDLPKVGTHMAPLEMDFGKLPATLSSKTLQDELSWRQQQRSEELRKLQELNAQLDAARLELRHEREQIEAALKAKEKANADEKAALEKKAKEPPPVDPKAEAKRKAQELEDKQKLAKTLASMKPDAGAKVIERLHPELAAQILGMMKPAEAGKIIAALPPDAGAALTQRIASAHAPTVPQAPKKSDAGGK